MLMFDVETRKRVKIVHHDLKAELNPLIKSASGDKMKKMGWEPSKSVKERIVDVVKWTLDNQTWTVI